MNIENKIFFSYAWRDMGLAMRIDNDLRNSGIQNIWRDRVDSQPAENFREEYLNQIDNCSHFILLDSENYRIHSNWCKDEINHFLEAKEKDPTKKLIACLAQRVDKWRETELFFGQNFYKFIDFGTTDEYGCIYDNTGKYRIAMDELCSIFGVKYQPWIEKDYEQDLLDELKETSKISENDRKCIIRDYENIRHYWLLNHSTVESRIRNFITDYERLSLESFMPYMLLTDYLLSKDDYAGCKDILQAAIEKFPNEPRGYRWLGTASFYLGKFDDAIRFYNKSVELSNQLKHKKQKSYAKKVLLNIICTHIAKKDYKSALKESERFKGLVEEPQESDYLLYKYMSICYLALEMNRENLEVLKNGVAQFPNLSDLYELLGHCYLKQRMHSKAIEAYKIAIQNSLSITAHISNYASLANAYRLLGNASKEELECVFGKVINYADVFSKELSNEDLYNIGATYFYAGNKQKSQEYFHKVTLPNKEFYR